jgi:acetylornithine deacetylase
MNLRNTVSESEVARLLGELVALPSVNPFHEALVTEPYGEARVADYVAAFGRALDLPVERQEVLPGRHNVLLTLAGDRSDRSLLFECHLDTVPGWAGPPDPFVPRLADGRLYGRGACDVKGTLTAMLASFQLLVQRGWKPARTVVLAGVVDEEHQARGVHRLARQASRFEAAVVGEPTNLAAVVAHKGVVRWRIRTRGRSVHSSKAQLGVNAIDAMVDLLSDLRSELSPDLARRSHPLVGSPTFSVCTIRGGVAVNVIPADCEIEVDRRTLPTEILDDVVAETRAAIQRAASRYPGLVVEVDTPFVQDPALGTPPDALIVRQLNRAVQAIVGSAQTIGVPFGTDASKLSQNGVPSVVFGPGDIDLAHTADESIALAEVARAAEILATLMLESGEE